MIHLTLNFIKYIQISPNDPITIGLRFYLGLTPTGIQPHPQPESTDALNCLLSSTRPHRSTECQFTVVMGGIGVNCLEINQPKMGIGWAWEVDVERRIPSNVQDGQVQGGASSEVGVYGDIHKKLGKEELPDAKWKAAWWSYVEALLNRMVSVSRHGLMDLL
jgi:hypothetical protein